MANYNFSSWPFLFPSRYFSLSCGKVATLQGAIPSAGCACLGQASRLASGWRDVLVGRELASIIDGSSALSVKGTSLELLDRAGN